MNIQKSTKHFIPPYITERLTQSANPEIRSLAIASLKAAVAMRTMREMAQAMPSLMAMMSPNGRKNRLIYDAEQKDELPGKLIRSESQRQVEDAVVNEVYDAIGVTYDFYEQVFQRNSLDGHGMTITASVHVAEVDVAGTFVPLANALWNGKQIAFGDGDGSIYQSFTKSLEVVAHELTHGVQSFTSNLTYSGESGALHEHFCDVFGILVRQWKHGEKAKKANWVIGKEVLLPALRRRGIRDMENPGTAYINDPDLGNDPQPAHTSGMISDYRPDRGGVHLYSGIPNRAFVGVAKAIGGKAWEVAGRIWYDVLMRIPPTSKFLDCAKLTAEVAAAHGAAAKKAVKAGWKRVGITV